MPLSSNILDLVDARIKAQRQAQSQASPNASALSPPDAAAASPAPSSPSWRSVLDKVDAGISARQSAAEANLAKMMGSGEATPSYRVRGAPEGPSLDDLVKQSELRAGALRQPEWWADGLVGGGSALTNWLWHAATGDSYDERMVHDPVFRELRRAALIAKLQSGLRDAAAYARAGRDDMARLNLRQADDYRRDIETLDRL